MTLKSTGVPGQHDDYYLMPVSTDYPTQVATTPLSGMALSVVPYKSASITSSSETFNICPTKASSTTTTSQGTIGYMINGEALYNAYEATTTAALSDNVSYTFTDSSGSHTAYFLDACNSHATPLTHGYAWHYHGVPTCLTATADTSTGPSHIIGIAMDGYPIYGGRDVNGNVIATSQLDSCNGITSATPEFPSGAYHYVLPIGETGAQSSLKCYSGTISSSTLIAMAIRRNICGPVFWNRVHKPQVKLARGARENLALLGNTPGARRLR
jgi:hypothetical protein